MLDENREPNTIIHCSKILSRLADGCPQTVQALLQLGAKRRLMQLLSHDDETVVVSVLRASRYLVPPKPNTSTRIVTISPIKMSRNNIQQQEAWRLHPVMGPSKAASSNLVNVDYLVCQNIEMFQASNQDVSLHNADSCGSGNIEVGQVGVQCIHCVKNSLVRVPCATIFPGKFTISISFMENKECELTLLLCLRRVASLCSIAQNLRQMAWYHFPSCPALPCDLKSRFVQLTTGVHAFERMDALDQYCIEVCEKNGIENKHPPNSGIVLKKPDEWFDMIHQPTVLHCKPTTSSNQMVANGGSPLTDILQYDQVPGDKIHDSPPSSYYRHIHCEKENTVFQQVRQGLWKCRYCMNRNIQVPSSVWQGESSPSAGFIANHMKECPGRSVKYLTSSSAPPSNPEFAKLHPAQQHNYHVKNHTSTEISSTHNSCARNAITLVLDEDKELLTDFVLLTFEQLQVCYLESSSNRYALPDGFPGLECKHCSGTKTARRFFWSCPQRFKVSESANVEIRFQCIYLCVYIFHPL